MNPGIKTALESAKRYVGKVQKPWLAGVLVGSGLLLASSTMILHMASLPIVSEPVVSVDAMYRDTMYEKSYKPLVQDQSYKGVDLRFLSAVFDLQTKTLPHIEAVVLRSGDTVLGVFKSIDEANMLMDTLKSNAVPASVEVEAIGFKEAVRLEVEKIATVDFNGFSTIEETLEFIHRGVEEIRTHEIVAQDTLGGIAALHQISLSDLIEANPEIATQKYLKVGAVLNLSKRVPLVTVQAIAYKTSVEVEEPEIIYEASASLFEGQTKTLQKGQEAKTEVKAKLFFENGLIVSREVLESNEIQAMVPSRIATGTKQREVAKVAKVASGLSLPARGYKVYSRFGTRGSGFHTGIDLSMPHGSEIYAADSGKVVFSGNQGTYGLLVVIDHGNNLKTYYSHNSKNLVRVGDVVSKGDLIALVGQTGRATGPHVHFEVRQNNVPVNPERFLNF
jgi:murein DD-endopeptidase MepM/ murein hydrolase activator NlpD